jgi:hypothetical protein
MSNQYEINKCEDTQRPALYRKFTAFHPGAMSGWELIAHVEDFGALEQALVKYQQQEELKILTDLNML